MNFSFFKNPTVKFLFFIFLFYISWYCVYNLWLHPNEILDTFVINKSRDTSKWILEHLGYVVFTGEEGVVGIDGSGGIWIGDGCNGIALFALFTGFIVAYRGNWKLKIVYIILGIACIQLLNVIRFVALAILDVHSRAWTEFNHTYTFTIIIYAFIFMLWILWVNKFSKKSIS